MISGSGRSGGEGIGYPLQISWASLVAQLVKNPPAMQETWVQSLVWEDPLEKGKATHSSILPLTISFNFVRCGRPGFDPWVGKIPWRRNWQPTPVLLPGKSHGRRSVVGYSPWGRKESDTTERLHFPLSMASRDIVCSFVHLFIHFMSLEPALC